MVGLENKLAGLLHMARRAGRLSLGFDACERACHKSTVKLIVMAEDLAPRTGEKMQTVADACNLKVIKCGTKEFWGETFKIKDVGIMGVEDSNIANGIRKAVKNWGFHADQGT